MKQLIITIFALLLPMVTFADKEGKCGDNVTYYFESATGILTIQGSGPMWNAQRDEKGKLIRTFEYDKYEKKIIKVVIKDGVTTIGAEAFRCRNMTSITIPNSVTSIGEWAFGSSHSLQEIIIPNSIKTIGSNAFIFSGLKSIIIPNSVKEIGSGAFSHCQNLETVSLPNSLSCLEETVFYQCENLASIASPSSVKNIGKDVFTGCAKLKTIYVASRNTVIDEDAFGVYGVDVKKEFSKIVYGEPERPLLAQSTQKSSEVKETEPVAKPQKEIPQQTVANNPPKAAPKQEPKPVAKQEPKVEQKVEQKQVAATPAPKQEPQKVTTTNVDKDIPHIAEADRNTFAVIIGNENYKNEASVPFAENDAKIFKQYVQQTLGVPEKQIRFITNAGLNDLRIAIRWLKQAMEVCGGQGKAIFYYAGHGIPDEGDKTAYLLPTDGIGGDAETAYSLQKLYAEFGKMQAQRTMIFLDACFSGSKRDGQMMASARGIAIKVKPSAPEGNMVVFTAAQGDETAYPYKEQQHGMFTYYLLKKLQDSKGNITLGELSDYLTREVKRESFVENNKMQTPTVNASSALANSWRSMKLR